MKKVASPVWLTVLTSMLALVGCGTDEPIPPPTPGELVVVVSAGKSSLRVNETVQLTATGQQDDQPAELGTVTYSTSDAAIADVNPSTGLVTAKGTGTATLTATAKGKAGTLTLKVEGGAVHAGTLSANETWRVKDSPHYVLTSIKVEGPNKPSLTIEAGAIVRFAPRTGLFVGDGAPGLLKAQGTAQQPIQFVADSDSPTKGSWQGIMIAGQSGADSVLRHATLSHCGGEYPFNSSKPCLMVSASQPVIADVSIHSSGGSGFELCDEGSLADGSARINVSDSDSFAMVVHPNYAHTLPTDSKLTNNNPNALLLIPGLAVKDSQTWPLLKDGANKNVPYLVMQGVEVGGPNAPTLTLQPGTEVRFLSGAFFEVGTNSPGTLKAEGAADQPIQFVAHSASPTKGFWRGVMFGGKASPNTVLRHATLSHCGGEYPFNSSKPCLMVSEAHPVIADVSIHSSGGSGFELCDEGSLADGSAQINVSDSASFAMVVHPNYAHTLPTDGRLINSNPNVVLIIPDATVKDSQTWPLLKDGANKNVPYMLLTGLRVGGPNTPTLTLQAGTEVRFQNNTYIEVGGTEGAGGLIAEGTATEPIVFTSTSQAPAKGAWSSLYFHENRLSTTSLKHTVVDFAGGTNLLPGAKAGITVVGDTQGAFIQNTTISNSGECGIRRDVTSTRPTFTTDFTAAQLGNTFTNNNGVSQCGP